MKLFMESWKRFLKEDPAYFGQSFVDFQKRVKAGEHPLKVAEETLIHIGKGSTRKVFGFPDNKTHLLKIINVDIIGDEEYYEPDFKNPFTGFDRKHKTVSNENEADLKMQQRYPFVFPRTYEAADDYSWILAERVQPIGSRALASIFNIPQDIIYLENRKEYVKLMGMATEYMKPGSTLNEGDDPTVALDPDRVSQVPPREEPWDNTRQRLDWLTRDILADSHNRQLFRAVAMLGIPPRELIPKNLGISKFGGDHLVILDASLWEYEE